MAKRERVADGYLSGWAGHVHSVVGYVRYTVWGQVPLNCNANSHIHLANMYEVYHIRPALLKSKQYYNNAFRTAVSYDALMSLKQVLIVHGKFSDLN